MIGGALGYLRDWGLVVVVDARQLISVPTGFQASHGCPTTCAYDGKVDCEWVGVVDTRDLPLTDCESVNGILHLQLPLCSALYERGLVLARRWSSPPS
jgi:hypothetical protein